MDILHLRHEASGDWFLETAEFQQWLSSKSGSILCCHGEKGAGKTTMLAIAARYLRALPQYSNTSRTAIAHVYAEHVLLMQSRTSCLAKDLLEVLIRQLGSKDNIQEQLSERLRNLYSVTSEYRHGGTHATSYEQVFLALCSVHDDVVIFADAVDQALDHEELLSLLSIFQAAADRGVKIFVTVGADCPINDLTRASTKIYFEPPTSEIKAYLDMEISNKYGSNPQMSEIVKRAALYTGRNYLKAYLTICLIKYFPGTIFTRNSPLVQEKADLNIYDVFLGGVMQDSSKLSLVAKRILGWVMYAERTFRVSELCAGLLLDSSGRSIMPQLDEASLIKASLGLLTVDTSTKSVIFKNPSIRQWLHAAKTITASQIHEDMARACLAYLTTDNVIESLVMVNYSTRTTSGYRQIEVDNGEDAKTLTITYEDLDRDFPFAQYASWCWPEHLCKSNQDDLDALALEYLEKRYLASTEQVELDVHRNVGRAEKIHHYKFTPVVSAARHGLEDLLRKMFDEPERWNIHEELQDATSAAVSHSNLSILRFLASQGADLYHIDANSRGLLHTAASHDNTELLEWLLSYGLPVNGETGRLVWTPLHEAVTEGQYWTAEMLLKYGADVQARDRWKGDAMTLAIEAHREDIVRLLILHGYDLTYRKIAETRPFLQPSEEEISRLLDCSSPRAYRYTKRTIIPSGRFFMSPSTMTKQKSVNCFSSMERIPSRKKKIRRHLWKLHYTSRTVLLQIC